MFIGLVTQAYTLTIAVIIVIFSQANNQYREISILSIPTLQIQKRDDAVAQLQSEDKELKLHYEAACGRAEEAEKAREALQSQHEQIVDELRSHEEAMSTLQEKVEEEGERREEELNRCREAIEELKQQLEDSEKGRMEQQHKVMVVNGKRIYLCPSIGKGRRMY